jgi:hypothetical protein
MGLGLLGKVGFVRAIVSKLNFCQIIVSFCHILVATRDSDLVAGDFGADQQVFHLVQKEVF